VWGKIGSYPNIQHFKCALQFFVRFGAFSPHRKPCEVALDKIKPIKPLSNLRFQTFCQSRGRWTTPGGTGNVGVDPHFELSMICCAFLIADSSGALSFFKISIAFCAEAVASFLLPSLV
jgi:hypothetical protein